MAAQRTDRQRLYDLERRVQRLEKELAELRALAEGVRRQARLRAQERLAGYPGGD